MATRSTLRRKVVLPVTVIRNDGEQRQLAHTLDVTSNSARLAGLHIQVEPGDVIEVQRGVVRAKFKVFWVGATGTPLAGQIGTQCMVAGKNIWGISLPPDEPDNLQKPEQFRSGDPLVRSVREEERRGQARLECNGSAVLQAPGLKQAVYAPLADISEGGAHLNTATVMPLNTTVSLRMNIDGFLVEMQGIVRSSDPLAGMGISFLRTMPENHQKLALVLRGLRQKSQGKRKSSDAIPLVIPAIPLAG